MASPLGETSRLGPYEIVENIGHGAMGDVYMARDSRLSRNVAIKVISEAEVDEARRRRFVQEARAASALNHPNIVTIHDFGSENGLSYIVSELVEGESLRSVINRGAVPLRQLVSISTQIADALTSAHEAGIVHRDLKPENIMITRDGRVKLLDFGLAKPLVPGDPERTLDDNATQPGALLGTLAYMSPEQARGAPPSFQSDQFSLGIILHEMATGRHPFRRDTPMETLIAIANFERPPFTPGPVALRMLVERALSKDPAQRFQRTREILERFAKIRQDLPEAPSPSAAIPNWWQRVSPRTVSTVLIGIAVVALGAITASRLLSPALADPASFRFVPFAAEAGVEAYPAWSPRGRVIAYSAEREGILQIYTRAQGALFRTEVTNAAADCLFPFWSPDGSRLYYISAHDGRPALRSINAAGGAPVMVMEDVAQAAISPDGKTLAMLREHAEAPGAGSLWLSSPPDAAPTRYTNAPFDRARFLPWSFLRFSPDGKWLALWGSRFEGGSAFWLIPLNSDAPERRFEALDSAPSARDFTWLPDSRQILFAGAGYGVSRHLWAGEVENSSVRPISNGAGSESWPAASPAGTDAAFTSVNAAYVLDTAPLIDRAVAGASTPLMNATSPAWAPNGREYAYVANVEGAPEIRLRSADGGWERALVKGDAFKTQTYSFNELTFAPNGQSIAYTRSGADGQAVWISTVSGDPPARLNPPRAEFERSPTWSPDGNSIAYLTARKGHIALMKTAIGGRTAVVRENAGVDAAWSPDGREIATIVPGRGVLLVAADGSMARTISSSDWLDVTWTGDGSSMIGIEKTGDGRLIIASLARGTGEEGRVADLGPWPAAFSFARSMGLSPLGGLSLSPDGRTLAFSRLQLTTDVWLIEGLWTPGLLDRLRGS
jgi:Tol biopolymer transport system component/tRNA A-37 threonylcarbamoyl transferase component Bud32